MPTLYRDWAPTACDSRGLCLDERQEWLVVPCIRTRDSGPREESNFHSALASLGGESDDVEVHRFGHWGPGWFEVILAAPGKLACVESIECALADYPLLDDSDCSERESEAAWEAWEQYGRYDYLRVMRSEMGLSDLAHELISDHVESHELFAECERNESTYFQGDSPVFPDRMPTRDLVAAWLWAARPKWHAERRNARAAASILASRAR